MTFYTITNLTRNTVSISLLFAVLFYQKDESDDYLIINRMDYLEQSQEASFKKRIHLGFSKYGKVRLQQSTDDTRQL
ncbi:hypothetical protein [Flagellimonas sp.]|jgi:hypothetical protein|uniref:hypothetical protein n=1 Tax=Flagellimonas sp. TaxID=2058762 RepID=UPI003BAB895E|tara:strand:+ start:10724 stop:10954 length:231 start_codon:yes stop_codon:yes gene_type:complete